MATDKNKPANKNKPKAPKAKKTGNTATAAPSFSFESLFPFFSDSHGPDNLKPPVDTSRPSPNRSSRNGTKISKIVLHCTEAGLESSLNTLTDPNGRQVSVHYVIARNGTIYQLVPDQYVANHCKGANRESIGIENVGTDSQAIADAQGRSLCALLVYLLNEYDIPRSRIYGHDFTPGRLTSTSCPDQLFGGDTAADLDAWLRVNLDPLLANQSALMAAAFVAGGQAAAAAASNPAPTRPTDARSHDLVREGIRRAVDAIQLSDDDYRHLFIRDIRRELGQALDGIISNENERLVHLNVAIRKRFRKDGWLIEVPPLNWYLDDARQTDIAPTITEYILSKPITKA